MVKNTSKVSKVEQFPRSCLGCEPAETVVVADADLNVILRHLTLETLLQIEMCQHLLVLQYFHLQGQNGSVHCILQLQVLRVPWK